MPDSETNKLLIVSSDDSLVRMLQYDVLPDLGWGMERVSPEVLDVCLEIKSALADIVLFFVDEDPGFVLTSVSRLMLRNPMPVLVATRDPEAMKSMILKCLEIGAVDVLSMPQDENHLSREHKRRVIRVLEGARRGRLKRVTLRQVLTMFGGPQPYSNELREGRERLIAELPRSRFDAVGIAISTGGPHALSRLLPGLPASLPVPVFVVQHIIKGFIGNIARRLDSLCAMHVKVAEPGEQVAPGMVYLAPDAHHLKLEQRDDEVYIVLDDQPDNLLFQPSADELFASMADVYGPRCIAAIMTGMGSDGVNGLRALKQKGAFAMAQDMESSVIFGMARVAIEHDLVDRVEPLHIMGDVMLQLIFGEEDVYSSNEMISS